jgi:peptidoglycan/LPS O-acetylase OafA/YrhL
MQTRYSKGPRRLLPFDVVRILAISLIIIAHLGFMSVGPVSVGGFGVTLFLVMSGLLLALTDRKQPWGSFMWQRAQRIYPTYWVCLALSMVIAWKLPLDAVDAILMVTGTCSLAGRWGCSILNTSWFIGTIMVLYGFYPLLKRCMASSPIITLVALYGISLFMQRKGVTWMALPLKGSPQWSFPLCRVFEFGVGIAAAAYLPHIDAISPRWINYLAELSFPAFLLHWPLLKYQLPIPLYIMATIASSALALYLVQVIRMPRFCPSFRYQTWALCGSLRTCIRDTYIAQKIAKRIRS